MDGGIEIVAAGNKSVTVSIQTETDFVKCCWIAVSPLGKGKERKEKGGRREGGKGQKEKKGGPTYRIHFYANWGCRSSITRVDRKRKEKEKKVP